MGHVAKGPMARQLVTEGLEIAHLSVATCARWASGCRRLLGEALRDAREEGRVPARHGLAVVFLASEIVAVLGGVRR